jgi:hypothetical protein
MPRVLVDLIFFGSEGKLDMTVSAVAGVGIRRYGRPRTKVRPFILLGRRIDRSEFEEDVWFATLQAIVHTLAALAIRHSSNDALT